MRPASLALALLLLASPAHAFWGVTFGAVADSEDPVLVGYSTNGLATFDSDPYGIVAPTMTSFSFDWDGVSWDETNTTFTWTPGARPGITFTGLEGLNAFTVFNTGDAGFTYTSLRPLPVSSPVQYQGSLDGWTVGFAPDPIPEPSSAPLLALGLAFPLGFLAVRKMV